MTNEEAIKLLKPLINKSTDGYEVQALDMAIKALEFKTNYNNFWEEVKLAGYEGREVEIHKDGRVFMIREVSQ